MANNPKAGDRVLINAMLLGVFALVCAISWAGITQERMDLTVVALALVSFMGLLLKYISGQRLDDDDE